MKTRSDVRRRGKCRLALGAVLATFACWAANHTVSTPEELADAIADAAGGDKITLRAGTYDLSVLTPSNPKDAKGVASLFVNNKALHFVGEDTTSWRDRPDNTTGVVLKGTNTARIVYGYAGSGRASTFCHITFDGGVAPSGMDGGAIYYLDCRFNGWASNCVFRNCRANSGGATAYVTLRDCLFENNEASYQGGAAYCGISTYNSQKSVNEIKNCVFRGNRASYGGAVRWFGQGQTAGCTFRTNCATAAGGAMHANNSPNSTLDLGFAFTTNCLFEGNCVIGSSVGNDYGGGAVFGAGPTVGCTFIGNAFTNSYGGAISRAQGGVTGCVFRANAGYWGGAIAIAGQSISGCVFEGNAAGADGGAVYKSSNVVTGSVFTANRATGLTTSKGGGLWGAKAIGCAFTNNVGRYGGAMAGDLSSNPGVAIDCTFSSNYSIDTGGALYKMTAMTNCWVGFNQSTNQGGACQWCYGISGCVFTGNRSMKNRGGALSESEAFDSVFSNNYTPRTRGGAGTKSTFTRCAFSGAGAVSCGWCRDCTFTGVTPASAGDVQLFDCLHNAGGTIGVTNCLISGCSGFDCLFNNEGSTGSVVNCTFAGNTVSAAGRVLRVISGPHYQTVNGVTSEAYHVPAQAEIVNCLFAGNTRANGTAADLSMNVNDSATSIGTTECTLMNCLHEATDSTLIDPDATLVNVFQGSPHFVAGDRRFPDVPYYAIRYASGARNRGVNAAWMADATDMAGNARINDGTVDIGCYECYLPCEGTMVIFR